MDNDSRKQMFENRVRMNYVKLLNDTQDTLGICDYLYAHQVITKRMHEVICSERTPHNKNSKLYDLLPTRGPKYAIIYDALVQTGNQAIAELLLEGLCETSPSMSQIPPPMTQTPQPPKQAKFFEALTAAVTQMRPLETQSARGNHKMYKTAIDIYGDDLPKTQVGMNELPFVAALALDFPKKDVTSWYLCPAVSALDAAYNIYKSEIQTVRAFLSALDGGGIEIMANCTVPGIMAVMETLRASPWVQIPVLQLSNFSENFKRHLEVQLHAIACGSQLRFILRKDADAKPPAYLCYNAAQLCPCTSVILRDADRVLVNEILKQDETNHATASNTYRCCPFTWCSPSAPCM